MGNLESAKNITTMEKLVQCTAVNSTSGTSIDFTGIPSWAKRITVMFNGVSTNGTSPILIQLGITTIQTTGYSMSLSSGITCSATSNGFQINRNTTASTNMNGVVNFLNISSNVWCESGLTSIGGTATANDVSVGSVTLSGTLDRVRITTVNGTDTFDAGQINIMYEG